MDGGGFERKTVEIVNFIMFDYFCMEIIMRIKASDHLM